MSVTPAAPESPLARAAAAVPAPLDSIVALGAPLVAAGLALFLAAEQSHDGTQWFMAGAAVAIAASVAAAVLASGVIRAAVSGLAAGVAFFAGVIVLHHAPGAAMAALGAIAWLAALAETQRTSRRLAASVVAFLAALPVLLAWLACMVLVIGVEA